MRYSLHQKIEDTDRELVDRHQYFDIELLHFDGENCEHGWSISITFYYDWFRFLWHRSSDMVGRRLDSPPPRDADSDTYGRWWRKQIDEVVVEGLSKMLGLPGEWAISGVKDFIIKHAMWMIGYSPDMFTQDKWNSFE